MTNVIMIVKKLNNVKIIVEKRQEIIYCEMTQIKCKLLIYDNYDIIVRDDKFKQTNNDFKEISENKKPEQIDNHFQQIDNNFKELPEDKKEVKNKFERIR